MSGSIGKPGAAHTGRGVRMWAFGNDIKFCYVSFTFSLRALISVLVLGCGLH